MFQSVTNRRNQSRAPILLILACIFAPQDLKRFPPRSAGSYQSILASDIVTTNDHKSPTLWSGTREIRDEMIKKWGIYNLLTGEDFRPGPNFSFSLKDSLCSQKTSQYWHPQKLDAGSGNNLTQWALDQFISVWNEFALQISRKELQSRRLFQVLGQ